MRYERGIRAVDIAPIIRGLVETRMAWGLPTRAVAQRIGCQSRTLSHMESGQKLPSFKVLVKWADVLGFELGLRAKSVASAYQASPHKQGQANGLSADR